MTGRAIGPVLAAIALGLSLTGAVAIGSVGVAWDTVWGVVVHRLWPGLIEPDWSRGHEAIIWNVRLPRAILAGIVGAGLAVVGTTLQAVSRNPLADPHLLGISSGGAFGAVLALLHTGLFLGPATVPIVAFAGALAATVAVLGVVRLTFASSPDRLILAGVAVSFVAMSATNLLIFLGDPRASHTVVFWMLGGLGLANWSNLPAALAVLILVTVYFRAVAAQLNAMGLGDETAASLGLRPERFRLAVFVAGALLTAVLVALSGMIGFVGLMVPHIARMIVGADHRRLVPAAAIGGALFLIWADAGARWIMAPEDLPVGILTGAVGGAFAIWLLRRQARSG